MNAVVYYSNTGRSLEIARYFSQKLAYPLFEIGDCERGDYRNLVLVFPVHCQNIPKAVKEFLQGAKVERLMAVATYGKMCCGNVLYEIQNQFHMTIVAAAYVPTKHSYLKDDSDFCDFEKLQPIVEKVGNPSEVTLPKLYKNPFSKILPRFRSRLGVKLIKNSSCSGCGICDGVCKLKAIKNGAVNRRCIRCMKCVSSCPSGALDFKVTLPMRLYLRKKKRAELIVYV